jgi:HK97 family phage prohead protease
MPTPSKGESKSNFIDRCIPIVIDEGTAKNPDQAVAICNSLWDKGKNEKEPAMYVKLDEVERRCLPTAELRIDGDSASPKITGYAAVFDTWTDIGGWFKESIKRGAFAKTIKENDVRALLNHNPNFVLGRNKAGTLRLREDAKGLAIEIDPPSSVWASDLLVSMRRGDVNQMSFGFDVNKQDIDLEENARTLEDVTLFDVSVVTYPAYPTTSAEVRSAFRDETATTSSDYTITNWEVDPNVVTVVADTGTIGFSELDRIVKKMQDGEELTEDELRALTTYLPSLSVPPAKHTETPQEPPAKHSVEDPRKGDRWKELHDRADALVRKQIIKGDV